MHGHKMMGSDAYPLQKWKYTPKVGGIGNAPFSPKSQKIQNSIPLGPHSEARLERHAVKEYQEHAGIR